MNYIGVSLPRDLVERLLPGLIAEAEGAAAADGSFSSAATTYGPCGHAINWSETGRRNYMAGYVGYALTVALERRLVDA